MPKTYLMKAFRSDADKVAWHGSILGVYKYDGKELVRITQKDGLADNAVFTICPSSHCSSVIAPDGLV